MNPCFGSALIAFLIVALCIWVCMAIWAACAPGKNRMEWHDFKLYMDRAGILFVHVVGCYVVALIAVGFTFGLYAFVLWVL